MSIRVECPDCHSSFQVADEHAGKRGRCPHCKTVIIVAMPDPDAIPVATLIDADPAPPTAPEPESYSMADAPARASQVAARLASKSPRPPAPTTAGPTRSPAEILAAFGGRIEPVRPTPLYRLWILIVGAVMVLLPIVYLLLIALIGWLTYWHATTNHAIFRVMHGGRSIQVALIIYLAPIVIGGIMVAFMLKPILARPARGPGARKLDPTAQPLVFAFVDGVCTSVGAPTPCRIEVDCEVNASARLDKGLFSRDLVLTIGLPLASGLSLRQFAGVLAHEFGHFSQRTGMRVSYLIRTINHWFARVVYERDSWDSSLEQAAASQQGLISTFGLAGKAGVWLTRRILWVLMKLAQLVSSGLSHQMEFDADRYQARLVGGATVADVLDRAGVLSLASQGAYADLNESWKEGRLPNDLPRLVLNNVSQIPEPVLTQFREANKSARSNLFSTHPADSARALSAVNDTPGPGLFTLDGPATDLFRGFGELCREVTREHYRGTIGLKIEDSQLYPVEEVEQTQQVANEGYESLGRFFRGCYNALRPLPLSASLASMGADEPTARADVIHSRETLDAQRAAYRAAITRLQEWQRRAADLATAATLLEAGVKFKPADFQLASKDKADVDAARQEADRALAQIETKLELFEKTAAERLALTLGLIEHDDVAARVDQGQLRREEARALYPTVCLLGNQVSSRMPRLFQAKYVLIRALERHQQAQQSQPHVNAVLRAARSLLDALNRVRTEVGTTVPYPFAHAQENATLGQFAFPGGDLPPSEAVGDLLSVCDSVVDRLVRLQARALGRLCLVAEQVETALGLPTLETPVEPDTAPGTPPTQT